MNSSGPHSESDVSVSEIYRLMHAHRQSEVALRLFPFAMLVMTEPAGGAAPHSAR